MTTPLVCIERVSPSEWIYAEHMLKKPERHCQREGSSFWGPAVPCMLKQSPNRAKSQTNRPGLILGQFSALQNILFFLLWNLPSPIEIHTLGPFIHIHVNEVIVCRQPLLAVFVHNPLKTQDKQTTQLMCSLTGSFSPGRFWGTNVEVIESAIGKTHLDRPLDWSESFSLPWFTLILSATMAMSISHVLE